MIWNEFKTKIYETFWKLSYTKIWNYLLLILLFVCFSSSFHSQTASRNVSSANSTSKLRTNVSSALGNLSGVKPVIRADYSRNTNSEQQQQQQLSPLLGMRNNNRPVASHSQRRHDTNSAFSGVRYIYISSFQLLVGKILYFF